MAVLNKDEFFNRISTQVGTDTSESSLSFIEDMTDVLCVLNDNDVVPKFVPNDYIIDSMVDENGMLDLYKFDPKEYSEIRMRKARQLRGILQKGIKENKNEDTSEEEAEEKEGKGVT